MSSSPYAAICFSLNKLYEMLISTKGNIITTWKKARNGNQISSDDDILFEITFANTWNTSVAWVFA